MTPEQIHNENCVLQIHDILHTISDPCEAGRTLLVINGLLLAQLIPDDLLDEGLTAFFNDTTKAVHEAKRQLFGPQIPGTEKDG